MSYDPFDDNSSENNPDFQPHEWHDEQSTKSGMSSTMKIILIVTGMAGICFLLCCGTIGYFTYSMFPKIVTDPADIRAITEEIASVDVHPDLEPEVGMDMKLHNFMKTKMAIYTNSDRSASFSLQQMEVTGGGKVTQNVDTNEGMDQIKIELENKESEIKKLTIDGKEYEFTIVRGTDKTSGDKSFMITGSVDEFTPSKNKSTVVKVASKSKAFDEAAAIKMIESIKPK